MVLALLYLFPGVLQCYIFIFIHHTVVETNNGNIRKMVCNFMQFELLNNMGRCSQLVQLIESCKTGVDSVEAVM